MNKIAWWVTSLLCLSLLAGCGGEAVTPIAPATATAATGNTPAVAATDTTAPSTAAPSTAAPDTAATLARPTTANTTAPTAAPVTTAPTIAAPTNTAVSAAPGEAAAIVNGEALPLADYEAQVALAHGSFNAQMAYANKDEQKAAAAQLRYQVLEWMIDEMLIQQAANNLGIVVDEALVEAEFAQAKGDDAAAFAKWLQDNNLTEESFREQIRSELLGAALLEAVTEFLPEKMEQVRLRHILVASESEAREILSQIKSPNDFTRLAQQYSLDLGTAESGGDLGFYPRGVLAPELERVAFGMVVGQVSDVVSTTYGYHIIQLLERDPQRELSPEMTVALQQQAFTDWLAAERARATIEYLVD